jgi:hypothetical protein
MIRRVSCFSTAVAFVVLGAGAARACCLGFLCGGYSYASCGYGYGCDYGYGGGYGCGYGYGGGYGYGYAASPYGGGYASNPYGGGPYGYSQPSAVQTQAENPSRQYYTPWVWDAEKKRYTCTYNYKANPNDTTFKVHRCEAVPSQPNVVYFANNEQKIWGKCNLNPGGGYSAVKPGDRVDEVANAQGDVWTPPGPKMPKIPASTDNAEIKLPTPAPTAPPPPTA